ncbi:siderophore ABC transporter substrate-binding protein [Ectopseudomonas khazarica]|uniref:siderophore ABC transporter substrate-binding protein n=1 Tax=Ectopseudomonas khazarica TaxID=2502979 RepID=UPI0037CA3EEC
MSSLRSAVTHLVAAFALLALASAHGAYPLTVNHAQGGLTLNEAPKRIAVFDLATLDTLDALGVSAAGVPQMAGPEYLKDTYAGREVVNVGTLFEPDYAALEALRPDLIIIAGRSSGAYAKLAQLAPTLDLSIAPDAFLAGVRQNLRMLGDIFDRQARAARLDAELQQALAATHEKSQGLATLTLFTVNDALMVHAPGERFGMLAEVLGTTSVAPPVDPASLPQGRPAPGSPEAMQLRERHKARLAAALQAEPDWLVILDRGAATGGEGKAAQTLAAHPGIAASTAWTEGRVFYLDPATWYIATGGYQGLMKTLEDFAAVP